MPDYSKGKIYTIRCRNDPSLIYVGSTIQPLSVRFGGHKADSQNKSKYPNHQLYCKIEDWNDWYIELYLTFPCNSVEELRKKEGEVIREIGTLNRGIAGRTPKEWRKDNKEKLQEAKKKYYEENKEKLQETMKSYCENNKEKITEYKKNYCEENRTKIQEKKKKYYEENRAKIQEKDKQHYKDNLEKIKEYRKQSFTCDCGGHFTILHKKRHEATKIHQNYLQQPTPPP